MPTTLGLFRVNATRPGGNTAHFDSTTSYSISGKTVSVNVNSLRRTPISSDETLRLKYQKPTTKPLQDAAGNDVDSFSGKPVTNGATADIGSPARSSIAVNARTVTLTYDEDLDGNSVPSGSGFVVRATHAGTTRNIKVEEVALSGKIVTLTLESAVAHDETVTTGFWVSGLEVSLKDAAGNRVLTFATPVSTVNNTPMAAISTGAVITSMSLYDGDGNGTADTYWLGAKILVQVTFDRAVTVDTADGKPRLKIKLGTADASERWAVYESGSGSKVLTFAYTVAAGDASTAGVSVPKNALELNGGVIKDSGNSVEAALRYAAEAANPRHKVDHEVSDTETVGEAPDGAPSLESVLVQGDQVALIYDEGLREGTDIEAGHFRVEVVGGGVQPVTAVRAYGRGVVLTLGSALADADVDNLRVSYEKKDGLFYRIRDPDLNDAAEFGRRRGAELDGTAPTLLASTVQGDKLTLTYDELLYPGPDAKVRGLDFKVVVLPPDVPPDALESDYEHRIYDSGIEISGQRLVLTLESAVASSDVVQLRYTVPPTGTRGIRDFVGNRAGNINQDATHGAPPALSSLQPPGGTSPPPGGTNPPGGNTGGGDTAARRR